MDNRDTLDERVEIVLPALYRQAIPERDVIVEENSGVQRQKDLVPDTSIRQSMWRNVSGIHMCPSDIPNGNESKSETFESRAQDREFTERHLNCKN